MKFSLTLFYLLTQSISYTLSYKTISKHVLTYISLYNYNFSPIKLPVVLVVPTCTRGLMSPPRTLHLLLTLAKDDFGESVLGQLHVSAFRREHGETHLEIAEALV